MERTWVTGSANDDKPLDWLFDLRHAADVTHITNVIDAVAADDDPSVGDWQTAVLVAECVAWLQGAGADLHDDARAWLKRVRPTVDDGVVERTVALVDRAATASALRDYWDRFRPERAAGWVVGMQYLRTRIIEGADASPPAG